MPDIKYKCPECEATLKVSKPVGPGKRLRCPKCDTMFTPTEPVETRPAAVRAADDEDDAGSYRFQESTAEEPDKGKRTKIFEEPIRDRFPRSKRGPAQAICTTPSNVLLAAGLITCLGWLGFIVVKLFPIIFYDTPWSWEAVGFLFGYAVEFVYAAFIIKGTVDMQNLDSYTWSVISAYMGIVPVPLVFVFDSMVPAFFWLATLGGGIYCLMTLRKPLVKEGFMEPRRTD